MSEVTIEGYYTNKERLVIKFLSDAGNYRETTITRKSSAEFDFTIKGKSDIFGRGEWHRFTASPKLALISEAEWINYFNHSSYPEMVFDGDWSGVRDSHPDDINVMFNMAYNELILKR